MSGICGWINWHGEADPAHLIAQMAGALTRFDQSTGDNVAGVTAALASTGQAETICLHREKEVWLALHGHPRWEEGSTCVNAINEVAARFAAAYRDQGTAALQNLKGDFALALLHESTGEALLAVDRMAVRPLLYQTCGNGLLFASTAHALAAHPAGDMELNPQGLFNYVYFHMVPGPSSVYRELSQLSAGHYLRFTQGKAEIRPYWEMVFSENRHGSVADYKEAFLHTLRGAVKRHSNSDAVGAFLSGGTDSSTVCGMLKENGPAHAYSIGFDAEGYDEMEYARIAVRHFQLDHHAYYVTPADVADAIPKIAAIYDQPFGNASAVPTYFCARLARQDGRSRLLGGDGGDELFGGNARYAKQHLFSLYSDLPASVRKGIVEPLVNGFPGGKHLPPVRKLASYIAQASIPMPERYESYNLLERLGHSKIFTPEFLASVDTSAPMRMMTAQYQNAHAETLINRMLALDIKFTLADSDLPKVSRMCELAGMDVAFPLLDDDVVAFSASLPPNLKLKGTKLRYFFKEALRDYLPDEILTKRKHGFGLPFGLWLQTFPALQELARDSLHGLKERGIVNAAFIDELTGSHMERHAAYYGTMVWVLMMLEQWFQANQRK